MVLKKSERKFRVKFGVYHLPEMIRRPRSYGPVIIYRLRDGGGFSAKDNNI